MAKLRKKADGTAGLGRNMKWSERQAKGAKGVHTAAERAARSANAKEVKGGSSTKAKRHLASQYVNFDQSGKFAGYKKGAPKGYVYMPGSRYLTNVKNLRLLPGMTSPEQRKFVKENRAAVEAAIESASRAGAFKDFGLGRKVGGQHAADFDFDRAGDRMAKLIRDYFHHHAAMHVSGLWKGRGPARLRARAQWSFAFGQDGRKR